jgi:hypothetical protein
MAIEGMYPAMRLIHIFPHNARYHQAKLVQAWLAQPGRRIRLHFIPHIVRASTRSSGIEVDAQSYHSQQVLQLLQGLQHHHAELPS